MACSTGGSPIAPSSPATIRSPTWRAIPGSCPTSGRARSSRTSRISSAGSRRSARGRRWCAPTRRRRRSTPTRAASALPRSAPSCSARPRPRSSAPPRRRDRRRRRCRADGEMAPLDQRPRRNGGRMRAAASEEARPLLDRALRALLPIAVLAIGVALWELVVRLHDIPPYVLPGPRLVLETLVSDWAVLSAALMVTLATTLEGFLLAAVGGVGLAVLFNQSRLIEYSLYPYAVILQVTPIVAIAPLLLVYLPQPAAVLACAWIVAFFPVLANTTLGLNSVDHNLADLYRLYGATRSQVLIYLKLPSALPHILAGIRIAGGLSLIGAVVAEIAAGSAGAGSGLAYRIAESGYRLNIPRMFAALLLLSIAGIAIFFALSLLSHLLLRRWHESAVVREV